MIDLIEDRIGGEYLVDNNFSLYELYEIYEKLKNLEGIKNQMIDNSTMADFDNELVKHHNHLSVIGDNLISIMKVIKKTESKIYMDLGGFGKLFYN